MSDGPVKQGQLTYTSRAFEQDATQAIRGDMVKALIELITNADDAYSTSAGTITIVVQEAEEYGFAFDVSVHDAAGGLTSEELLHHFTTLGGQKSDLSSRGLLGRGAKDTASLGRLMVRTVKAGAFSELVIMRDGSYQLTWADEPVTDAIRQSLLLADGEHGLTAIVSSRPEVRVLKANRLADTIANHAQLRDLVARRPVVLRDLRLKGGIWESQLQAPQADGTEVLSVTLPVAGYQSVSLQVRRLPSADHVPLNEWSTQGLLLRSGRTCFENTWFDLDRSYPTSAMFAGSIDAPEIAVLIRAFDEPAKYSYTQEANPMRMIGRDRAGLLEAHPYMKKLRESVTQELARLFQEAADSESAQQREGVKLRKDLDVAAEALRDELARALDELEEDEGHDVGGDDEGVQALAIIPPRRRMRTGERATLTLRASTAPSDSPTVSISYQSVDGVLLGAASSHSGWAKHAYLDAVDSQIYLDAGTVEGHARVQVILGGLSAAVDVVVDDTPRLEEPPTILAFKSAKVSTAPERRKRLVLRAPLTSEGQTVQIALAGDKVELLKDQVRLRTTSTGGWCEAEIKVRAGASVGDCVVRAIAGADEATCTVSVRRPTEPVGPRLEFSVSGEEVARRSARTPIESGIHVWIYAKHSSYNKVFGPYDESATRFRDEDSPAARAVLAEVISDELAAHLTELAFERDPESLGDAARVLRLRTKYAIRFLPILHKSLRGSG